ncbi:hypothetical protein I6U48_05660 [Clostridium sp. PL3]|uniref:Uncharacterized protein n=1 Tax=Clostridium thailandense TaxID=2794346 RepID=A0A949THL9_9CLOT|nr:hypothetical protein [Clostridium thailandense]MBV7272400.1 hypothetical protein [Clostridium thailandense]
MINFQSFHGKITMIDDFWVQPNGEELGCYKLVSVQNRYGDLVNFVVSPDTYFVDHVMVGVGDMVTGFYDANAPTPMIFSPQFRAIVMVRDTQYQKVKVDYFNRQLVSSDNKLRLNISPCTKIILKNDQAFTKNPANHNLIVVYGFTTMSIPAQTTPYKIIVMC